MHFVSVDNVKPAYLSLSQILDLFEVFTYLLVGAMKAICGKPTFVKGKQKPNVKN